MLRKLDLVTDDLTSCADMRSVLRKKPHLNLLPVCAVILFSPKWSYSRVAGKLAADRKEDRQQYDAMDPLLCSANDANNPAQLLD